MRTWYNLKASDEKTTICIFDAIGEFGVGAKSFMNDLRGVTTPAIDLEINSPGGDVFAGLTIYNGLRQSGKTVNVKIMGLAASAASLVAMAGDTIEMPANTFMMVHNPWSISMGDSEDMRATADMLDKIGASLAATYATRTGKTEDEIKAMLDAETWMTAQEAVDAGFATKVTDAVQANASYDPDRIPAHVKAVLLKTQAPAKIPPDDAPNARNAPLIQPFADQVDALASAAGMGAYASHWALALTDLPAVQARISECLEINALARVVKLQGSADALIRQGKTYAQAREALQNEIAAAADAEISSEAPLNGKPPQPAHTPTALRFKDAWASAFS